MRSDLVATFAGLHPFSLYSLEMKALATEAATGALVSPPEEARVIGETTEGPPGVAPGKSTVEPR